MQLHKTRQQLFSFYLADNAQCLHFTYFSVQQREKTQQHKKKKTTALRTIGRFRTVDDNTTPMTANAMEWQTQSQSQQQQQERQFALITHTENRIVCRFTRFI